MPNFKPARKTRILKDVVQQIETAIVSGDLGAGAKLPPERDLQEEFETSRTTIREALRVLEQKGLIAIRQGKGGGSFVAPKTGLRFAENLDLMVRLGQVSLSQLFAFRSDIEVLVFEAALYRATPTDVDRLKEIYARMAALCDSEKHGGDRQAFFEVEQELHRAMADLSGNPLYGLVLKAITARTWQVMRFLPNSAREMEAALLDWADILEAMGRGDIHRATTVIRAHHLNYRRVYERYVQEKDLSDLALAQVREDGDTHRLP